MQVEVISKGIGTKKSHHWSSDGQSSFTISETDKVVDGTEIIKQGAMGDKLLKCARNSFMNQRWCT